MGHFSVLVTVVLFAIVFAPLGLDYGISYFVGSGQWAPVPRYANRSW